MRKNVSRSEQIYVDEDTPEGFCSTIMEQCRVYGATRVALINEQDSWTDNTYAKIIMIKETPETDEEMNNRIQQETRNKKLADEYKRKQYEQLKKEFES